MLYPVNQRDLKDWERRHQDMHNDMNKAFGVAGTDLTGLDLQDKTKADAWFFQHYLQHLAVSQLCGLAV